VASRALEFSRLVRARPMASGCLSFLKVCEACGLGLLESLCTFGVSDCPWDESHKFPDCVRDMWPQFAKVFLVLSVCSSCFCVFETCDLRFPNFLTVPRPRSNRVTKAPGVHNNDPRTPAPEQKH
jgi:hypothetical protein